MKFQRKYTLKIQGKSGEIHTIRYPTTCIFDTQRRASSGINSGHFMLYNLDPDVLRDIAFDFYIDSERRSFQFFAGYATEGFEALISQGNVRSAFFYREGPDVITDIVIQDGGFMAQKAQIIRSRAFPWNERTEAEEVVQTLFPFGITLGAIGSLVGETNKATRGIKWGGSTWDQLKDFAAHRGGTAFVDFEKVYMLAEDDVLAVPGEIPELNETTGMIGTPRRSGWIVDAQMLFEPSLILRQLMKIKSEINTSIVGTFAVQTICHRGIISGAKDGGVLTALRLQGSPNQFRQVQRQ